MGENTQPQDLQKPCACGSGKSAGSCCMQNSPCACGSKKSAGSCCFASQQ